MFLQINCNSKSEFKDSFTSNNNKEEPPEDISNFSPAGEESKIPLEINCNSKVELYDTFPNNGNNKESPEDVIHDDQKDHLEINTSLKSENSSTNMSCYVVLEKINIQTDEMFVHSSGNKQEQENRIAKVSTNSLHENSSDSFYGIKCEESSNENYDNKKRDECSQVVQASNEIQSEGYHSVKNGNAFNKSDDLFTDETNEVLALKPCFVRLRKIDNIATNTEKNIDDLNENDNKKPKTKEILVSDSEPDRCNFAKRVDDDSSRKAPSESWEIYNICQPSTSKVRNDSQSENTRSKNVDSFVKNSPSENKVKSSESSEIQTMKNTSRNNNHIDMSNCDRNLPIPKSEGLSKSNTFHSGDMYEIDEDMKYYILLTDDGSTEIVNSLTGESYDLPSCHVLVTEMDKNSYESQKRSKIKNKFRKGCTSMNSIVDPSNLNLEFNPYLPSTSKDEDNCSYLPAENEEAGETKCFKSKSYSYCKRCCSQTINTKNNKGRLQINNSDAMLFLKKCVRKDCSCNALQGTPNEVATHDVCKVEDLSDKLCINQEIKYEPNPEINVVSEIPSDVKEIKDEVIKTNSSYQGKETNKSGSPTKKRKRKKKATLQKRSNKPVCNVKIKSSNLCKDTRRTPSVPMISLISQGTQATSADIRRSVRLVRRASSRRRSVPPARVSKNPYSSKISAKTLTKRPKNIHPRPECLEKATSTSDPLLEDDAIQTLQIISETLLSFTVVSCGISDLIIDRCPKLIHIEVQACRILKKLQLNTCPAIKRINVSQCPKLNICALATPIMSLTTDSYFLVSYEPCMQGYHPGEGEKAVLSKASLNQSVLLCHDFCNISLDSIQANFKEKILEWLRFLSQLHLYLNYKREKAKRKKLKSEIYQLPEYPWSHDLRKIHGQYSYSPSSDFCDNEGRYQLITNNPIFCDIFETNQLDTGFPDVSNSDAFKDTSLISYEVIEKYFQMQRKFVAFYIPITENNQIRF